MSESTVVVDADVLRSAAPYDDLDRRILAQMSMSSVLRLWVSLGIPLTPIPGEYWAQDVDENGATVAVVACPCGHTPAVKVGRARPCRAPEPCDDEDAQWAECPRGYAFTGRTVLVANAQAPQGA